jgi:lipopolysaccharide/colanic/teichoic acid biosynthesis glycosyltransferase
MPSLTLLSRPGQSDLTRWLDVSVSVLALILLSPVILAIGLAIRLDSPGPVLYRARRVGQDGRPFTLYKFRSMFVDAAERGPRLTRKFDPRVTRVGRVLRRAKLDELPQLFNTVNGDMSLVGPRPEDPDYVMSYSPDQLEVLRVRPGLTSPATIAHIHEEDLLAGPDWEKTYRENILPRKLRIELQYLSERTVFKDIGILARTAHALFFRPGRRRSGGDAACRS